MRKKREFIEGAFYHVTSRTNDKIWIFGNRLGRKIMEITLQNAKEKYRFRLANFCVMPTHLHLLIEPGEGTNLSVIMHWIKTQSAKWWNRVHGSNNHVWGNRYYARAIRTQQEYEFVMGYIDQNAVKAGLVASPEDWKASGAYYKARNLPGLVDFILTERQKYIKMLAPMPDSVARLLPPAQLSHTVHYIGAYTETIDRLFALIPTIPALGSTVAVQEPPAYLHYFTGTADYYICEYDGEDTMYGKARFNVYPAETRYQQFSLSSLKKNNEFLSLDLSWVPGTS